MQDFKEKLLVIGVDARTCERWDDDIKGVSSISAFSNVNMQRLILQQYAKGKVMFNDIAIMQPYFPVSINRFMKDLKHDQSINGSNFMEWLLSDLEKIVSKMDSKSRKYH